MDVQILPLEIGMLRELPFRKSVHLSFDQAAMKERWLALKLIEPSDGPNFRRTVSDDTLRYLEAVPFVKYRPNWDIENVLGLDECQGRAAAKALLNRKLIVSRKRGSYWTEYRRA